MLENRIDKLGLLNTVALFGALYCIIVSFIMSVISAEFIHRTRYEYLMNVIYGGVYSMAFGILAIGLLFWRLKRFNVFAKKFGISLIILAVLVQIFNIISTISKILY